MELIIIAVVVLLLFPKSITWDKGVHLGLPLWVPVLEHYMTKFKASPGEEKKDVEPTPAAVETSSGPYRS